MIDKNRDGDLSQFLHGQPSDDSPKSALFYYLTVTTLLQDDDLDDRINGLLRDKCCKNINNALEADDCLDDAALRKRNNIKKVKFHSWGGKRSGSASSEADGRVSNADLGKDGKVVIRTPFRPWGGKRQDQSNTFFDVIR